MTPSTPVVIPNRLPRYDANFKDSHEHATEYRTVAGTLAESSNIGTILVSETMKSKTLESYFRKFGLGRGVGHRLPGGVPRPARPVEPWSGTKRATVAFGQGISVTAVQAASVFQTIANDGVRVAPRLVESTTGADGTVTHDPGVGHEAGRLPPDRRRPLPHARGSGEPRRHRRGGPDPGLPGRRQDRHRRLLRLRRGRYSGRTASSSATPRPTTRRSWSRSSSRSRPTPSSAATSPARSSRTSRPTPCRS